MCKLYELMDLQNKESFLYILFSKFGYNQYNFQKIVQILSEEYNITHYALEYLYDIAKRYSDGGLFDMRYSELLNNIIMVVDQNDPDNMYIDCKY